MTTATTRPASTSSALWAGAGALGLAALGVAWGFAIAVGEVNALLLCLAALTCLFVLLDFRVGVVLLMLVLPASASALFPHQMLGITGLNPLNVIMAATLFSWFVQALRDGSLARFLPRPLLWLYLVPFAVAGALGVRHVGEIPAFAHALELVHFDNAVGYLRDVVVRPLYLVLFALLLGAAAARSQEPRRFLAPLVLSVWVIGLLVVGFVVVSGAWFAEMSGRRDFLSPLGIHANDLGRLYAVAYALVLFSFAETRDFALRGLLLASMLLITAALVFTFSRAAFLGFIVVNALFLLWRRSTLTWIAGALLLALIAWKLPGAVEDRLLIGFDRDLDAVSAGRIDGIWLPLVPTFWESPLFGHGLHSILWSGPLKSGQILQVSHPHNAYLQTLLDMGIVGFALVCAYFVHVWRGLRRLGADPALDPIERGFYQGGAAGLIAFAVATTGGSSLTPATEQFFLWFAIGMMYGRLARRDGPPA